MSINNSQTRTLWMGEILSWMDENYVCSLFDNYSYGFIEFQTVDSAESALKDLNGKQIPNTNKIFKLNWASYSIGKTLASSGCIGIYVGDLESNVTEEILKDFFAQYYHSIIGVKLVVDPSTKVSKNYGFVKFADQEESERALIEMNGMILSGKPMKLNQAIFKKMLENQALSQSLNNNFSKFSNCEFGLDNAFSFNGILTPNIARRGIPKDTYNKKNSFGSSQNMNFLNMNNFHNNNNHNNMNYRNICNNNNYNNDVFSGVENKFTSINNANKDEEYNLIQKEESELETKYEQMLMESIKKNKNLNDFYSSESKENNQNSIHDDAERFDFYDFMKKNNLDEYIIKKYNSKN